MSEQNRKQYQVTFKRGEEVWQTKAGSNQTLFEIARGCNAPVETLCHGIAACVRCKVKVLEGQLSDPTPLERDRLGNIFHLTQERLACQSRVCSDVVLQIKEKRVRKKRSVTQNKKKNTRPISKMKTR